MNIKKNKKKYIVFLVVALLVMAILIFAKMQLSGNVVSDFNIEYNEGKSITGDLTITTSGGELIPSDLVLRFKALGESYEFVLKDLLEDDQIEGNYYIDGLTVFGAGSGFGLYGNTEDSPSISFTLEIEEAVVEDTEDDEEEATAEEEAVVEDTDEETDTEEEAVVEDTEDEEEETSTNEEAVVEEVGTKEEVVTEEVIETPMTGLAIQKSLADNMEEKTTVYEKIKMGIGFIFGKKMTGKVSYTWEEEEIVAGSLDKDNSYTINIPEDKDIKIVKGSVKDGENELDEGEIIVTRNGDLVTLTTNYQNEETKGFGEDYLDDGEKDFEIDLGNLNMTFSSKDLIFTLEYRNVTIMEVEKTLGIIEDSEAEILPLSVITAGELVEELEELYNKIGNVTIETEESETDNKNVVKYKIGKYWSVFSYDKGLDLDKLNEYKYIDKRRFIEDLKNQLE